MMKTYVGLYIFASTAKDDVLDKQIEKACGEISRLSGKVLSTEILGKKTFARPMGKRDSGVYVRVRFEADPAKISTLTNRYHLMSEVFRVQITVVDSRREEKLARQAEARRAREAARAAAAAQAKAQKELEAAAAETTESVESAESAPHSDSEPASKPQADLEPAPEPEAAPAGS